MASILLELADSDAAGVFLVDPRERHHAFIGDRDVCDSPHIANMAVDQ